MITSQMSYEELANEVAKDYMDVSIIMRKKMPDALNISAGKANFRCFFSLQSLHPGRTNGF